MPPVAPVLADTTAQGCLLEPRGSECRGFPLVVLPRAHDSTVPVPVPVPEDAVAVDVAVADSGAGAGAGAGAPLCAVAPSASESHSLA